MPNPTAITNDNPDVKLPAQLQQRLGFCDSSFQEPLAKITEPTFES